MMVNRLSKHTEKSEAEFRDSSNTTVPSVNSRGQVMELNVTDLEDSEPRKEDLKQIIEMMDGFKASKVIGDKLSFLELPKRK